MPTWTPYAVAVEFVVSKKDWIQTHVHQPSYLETGDRIGKAHQIRFLEDPGAKSVRARLKSNEVLVTLPLGVSSRDALAQASASKAAVKALKAEAEALLPQRLRSLAAMHDATYNSVSIKQMRGRWGSCSSRHDIVLNCYLMQLPWHLIDYVLIHELMHTKVMSHSKEFWALMRQAIPDVQVVRKEMRARQPHL